MLPLMGLARGRRSVAAAIAARKPLLLVGPQGCGKTRLVQSAVDERPGVALRIDWVPVFHDLLAGIARELLLRQHAALRRITRCPADPELWVSKQTSMHLKGVLWSALESDPMVLILDGIHHASHPAYRFLQRLFFVPGMAIIGATRDLRYLNALGRLFWDPRIVVHVEPLKQEEATCLFDLAAAQLGIRHSGLEDFRERVIASARGNPGQILEMCRLAARPEYSTADHIKFELIRIDTIMRFAN